MYVYRTPGLPRICGKDRCAEIRPSSNSCPAKTNIFAAVNFWQRLKFYGIGLFIGLLIVYAMFGTRSCVTPNEMKMQELVFQHFALSDRAKCKLKCMRKNEALLKVELRHFEVNYDLSTVRKKPCGEYFIQPKEGYGQEYRYKLVMFDCDTITRIDDINTPLPCNCQ